MKTTLALSLFLVACGHAQHHAGHGQKGEKHGKLTPELHAFHEILAPRWHSEANSQRMTDTCAVAGEFETKAAAVKGAAAPEGMDAGAWNTVGQNLEGAVAGLKGTCAGTDQAAFDAAFHQVHEAFHAAMEKVEAECGR